MGEKSHGGAAAIPAGCRKTVEDTFHEVKRKRERRKEINDTQETVCRRNGSASTLGGRDGSEYNASSSNPLKVNPYDKRENGSFVPSVASSSAYRVEENNLPQQTPRSSEESSSVQFFFCISLATSMAAVEFVQVKTKRFMFSRSGTAIL
ncbi:hypothetical protein RJ639_017998 [Escallonia herrerae]|uniref:Uncharacterized protein n=1 Tax=Escallonia herrerae TaxID=1293975 RepID=A0AA88V7Z6_9ASTE|nr:hypothetical protein RJ639_017998 [Escallonia herrerae]